MFTISSNFDIKSFRENDVNLKRVYTKFVDFMYVRLAKQFTIVCTTRIFIFIQAYKSLGVTRNSIVGPDNVNPMRRGWGQTAGAIIGFPYQ